MRLVIATHNTGKLVELRRLLAWPELDLVDARALALEVPDEIGDSYIANATIKADAAARAGRALALGDDTGLGVFALHGAPGVDTASFVARAGGIDAARLELAQRTGVLDGRDDVRAELCCALVLSDGSEREIAEARVQGRLCWPPGTAPGLAAMFMPDDAEPLVQDGVLLHRRRAFAELTPALRAAIRRCGR
jgi:XTP/dITP diphosphohydrolase